jgi:hypothetical protein
MSDRVAPALLNILVVLAIRLLLTSTEVEAKAPMAMSVQWQHHQDHCQLLLESTSNGSIVLAGPRHVWAQKIMISTDVTNCFVQISP